MYFVFIWSRNCKQLIINNEQENGSPFSRNIRMNSFIELHWYTYVIWDNIGHHRTNLLLTVLSYFFHFLFFIIGQFILSNPFLSLCLKISSRYVYLLRISNSHYQSYLFKLTRDYQDVFHRYTDEKEYKEKKKQLL